MTIFRKQSIRDLSLIDNVSNDCICSSDFSFITFVLFGVLFGCFLSLLQDV